MIDGSRFNNLLKNKHITYGVPFLVFIFAGVFYLREFQSIRYEFRKNSTLDRKKIIEEGLPIKEKPPTLEELYESIKDLDIDNWENIRGPRLFEEFEMELICSVQNYHWGKKGYNSLVGKFASANASIVVDENKSYAEFWMGTHPNGASLIKSSGMQLSEHLDIHPHDLGLKVINHFGNQVPFLLKILSVEEPLSIQAHPTKSHAQDLHKKFPNIYKDGNHKPEIAIALTEFEALCGFRPLNEIKHFLKVIPEFKLLIDPEKINSFLQVYDTNVEANLKLMKDCFQSLMLCPEDVVSTVSDKLIARLKELPELERQDCLVNLVKRIHTLFPKDIGIFCVYWFNYLILSPGEALYLAPNEPHAYLYGDCVECMANSDNVVRAGLTPKFRDIPTLCQMLSYKNYKPSEILFNPIKEDEYSQLYSPPVDDFAVVKITLPKSYNYILKKRESASILLVIDGQGTLNSVELKFGKVIFIPAEFECHIQSERLVLFQAFCNPSNNN